MHFPNFNLTNKNDNNDGNIMASINYNLQFSFNITYKKYLCSSSPIANLPVYKAMENYHYFSFNNTR